MPVIGVPVIGVTVIAIDGPSAAGKGTLARAVARHFGFAHMDTGMLYRALARALLVRGRSLENPAAALEVARQIDFSRINGDVDSDDLRTAEVGAGAAVVGAYEEVRTHILGVQRGFARTPPGGASGAVLDGRDIGTVVCPDAEVKLFVTARLEVRALRRWREFESAGRAVSREEVLDMVRARDHQDETRAVSPLRRAADAHIVDTSDMEAGAAARAAITLVENHLAKP